MSSGFAVHDVKNIAQEDAELARSEADQALKDSTIALRVIWLRVRQWTMETECNRGLSWRRKRTGSQSPRRKEVQGSIYPGMKKGGSLKRVNGLWVRK